ncbi:hypothetical protein BZM27_35045 [Paraburkholderia steynii]|uniref:Uncharacterized protein n=1 Tax=Paraburkholderia steynii TaxID=1245441 RepID=A0A4R0X8K3_9BURK|nr:hypothetical protein BZM27_35045 [Paraburkholderia steynii]
MFATLLAHQTHCLLPDFRETLLTFSCWLDFAKNASLKSSGAIQALYKRHGQFEAEWTFTRQ